METIIPRTKNNPRKFNDVIKNSVEAKNFDYELKARKFFYGVNNIEDILGDTL